ncbi:MAG TPA: hypothetical protein GX517_11945 [Alicyclobacillus sp.]|nr:hypothetical protein [Alicyclobacillus sp.]
MNADRYPIRKIDREKAAPSGEVKVTFDPSVFNWHEKPGRKGYRREMAITVDRKGIRLSAEASRKFMSAVEVGEGGQYRAVIGTAPKAIAIRLAKDGETGLRMKMYSGALHIFCTKIVAELGWQLPVRLPSAWDEENKMIVAKLQ